MPNSFFLVKTYKTQVWLKKFQLGVSRINGFLKEVNVVEKMREEEIMPENCWPTFIVK